MPTTESAAATDVAALYDAYSARMYAVAIRILGDRDAAASALREIFAAIADDTAGYDSRRGSVEAWLIRITRDYCLARPNRMQTSPVDAPGNVSPRRLCEEAFFGGRTMSDLAAAYGIDEDRVRALLLQGMNELRR